MGLPGAPEDRETEHAQEGAQEGVAPGALSALLEELAHGPAPVAGGDFRPWPLPGTVIGRFELGREVGRGGFGVVYEARDRELQRSVAFKVVRPGRLRVGEDQFKREAEVIARFSHPNLVTLHDVGRSEYGPYLVLELLRGQTLYGRLEQGPVPVDEALRICAEMARGLAHAHAQGVVHRDLKPSNVFLCGDGRVKLLDFGISHAFGWRGLEGGTPAYMAPEQWRGAPEDERTDVYALGVILYRMLAGGLPFDTEDGGDEVLSSRKAPGLDVPGEPAIAALVARMLEKDPTRRPRDAKEVLAVVAPLQGEVERGTPVGPVRQVRRLRRGMAWLLAACAALGVAALAGVKFWHERSASPPAARAIAVLPFGNLGGSPDNEYFSDGLTEEILNLLTRVRELKVAASTSSFRFKNSRVDPAEVAKLMGVDVLLVGSVRREQSRLRIGAELVDARTGFRVWSQIYDRQLADVFAIQDDIARQVVGALELVLSQTSEKELGRPPTANLAAYDLYLRGRDFLRKPVTKANLEQATALLEQAIALDAGFAQAYARLCEAWLGRYDEDRAVENFDRAERACQAALSRDARAGDVRVALGSLLLSSGRASAAEGEFRNALALPGAQVEAQLGLARTHAARGQPDAAERAFGEARRLDGGDWRVYHQFAAFLFESGRYEEAARQYAEVVARTPENVNALNSLGAAHYMAGDFERASESWRASLALAPSVAAYSNVGSSYFYLGRFGEAAAMFEKAVALGPQDHRLWGNLADARAEMPGRAADAREAYQKAAALGEHRLRINPADGQATAELAHYHARLGHPERARRLVGDALRREDSSPYVHYYAALVFTRSGAVEAALQHLERAVALGYQRGLLAADAGLVPLRAEPRFRALLSQ